MNLKTSVFLVRTTKNVYLKFDVNNLLIFDTGVFSIFWSCDLLGKF